MACAGTWSCISLSSPPPPLPPNLYQIINKFELFIKVMRYSEPSVCKYMHNYIVASMKPQGNQKGLNDTHNILNATILRFILQVYISTSLDNIHSRLLVRTYSLHGKSQWKLFRDLLRSTTLDFFIFHVCDICINMLT